MAAPNPPSASLELPAPPATSTLSSRNASPARRGRAVSHTARLIRDISPTAALQAFTTKELALGDPGDACMKLHLGECSASQTELGVRVARAAQRLRAWCVEVERWGWRGTFEVGEDTGSQEEGRTDAVKSLGDIEAQVRSMDSKSAVQGALSIGELREREKRLGEIAEEVDELDFDELKDYVLGMHPGMSRPVSEYSDISGRDVQMMDDFTILVTHTLMQSLPVLLQLRHYLDTWIVRCGVIRKSFGFVSDLRQSRRVLELGRRAIRLSADAGQPSGALPTYKRVVEVLKNELQKRVGRLGRTLDSMLDSLEGRGDRLPDTWIDDFEDFEAQYGEWTAKVHQSILELEMRDHVQPKVIPDATTPASPRSHEAPASESNPAAERPVTAIPIEDARILDPSETPDVSILASNTADDRPVTPIMKQATTPIASPKTPTSPTSSVGSSQASPSKRSIWKPRQGALNAVMAKRRNKFKENLGKGQDQRTAAVPPVPPPRSPKRTQTESQDMDQQISNILTTLPTPIKLASNRRVPGPASRPHLSLRTRLSSSEHASRRSQTPSLTLARATTPQPGITDSEKPGPSTARHRKSAGPDDPEIQLYHLSSSRPGLAPIKLHIRRVGENGERLMVRVGGGWADLAEYLQQYAEHHGRRAVSESIDTVRMQELERVDTNTSTPSSIRSRSRDGTGSGRVSRRASAGANSILGDSPVIASSPLATPGEWDQRGNATPQSMTTSTTTTTTTTTTTSTGTTTTTQTSANPFFRSWSGQHDNGASLAGPRVKKLDLSGEKQEWIDGMVEKAKRANASDPRRDKRDSEGFSDIGTVGGVRRVVMRG